MGAKVREMVGLNLKSGQVCELMLCCTSYSAADEKHFYFFAAIISVLTSLMHHVRQPLSYQPARHTEGVFEQDIGA